MVEAAKNQQKSEKARCKIKKADLGVLFDRAIKYDKMINKDPASDKKEQMHVIKAITKGFPVSIFTPPVTYGNYTNLVTTESS